MKVLLYFEKQNMIKQSGIGRAMRHQIKALESAGIEYTLDPKDTYDLVHINTLFNQSYKVLKKCKKKGIPVIVHGHSTVEDFENSFRCWQLIKGFFYRMMFRMYSKADYIITPTPYSQKLISGYKQVNCPVYHLSNGIDLEEYAPSQEKVKKFKEFFNISNEKTVIGIGLFFQRKGIHDFFEVATSFPDVKFIWFGNLSKILTQPKILKAIKKRPKNVIMPGYIDGDIIKGALQGANLLFFPSYEETEGIVELEGLVSKTPTLVRRIGVYEPWLVENTHCYKGASNEEFIEKIKYILNADNSSIIEEGYKIAEERQIKNIGNKLKKIYTDILNK